MPFKNLNFDLASISTHLNKTKIQDGKSNGVVQNYKHILPEREYRVHQNQKAYQRVHILLERDI